MGHDCRLGCVDKFACGLWSCKFLLCDWLTRDVSLYRSVYTPIPLAAHVRLKFGKQTLLQVNQLSTVLSRFLAMHRDYPWFLSQIVVCRRWLALSRQMFWLQLRRGIFRNFCLYCFPARIRPLLGFRIGNLAQHLLWIAVKALSCFDNGRLHLFFAVVGGVTPMLIHWLL